jgi:transposase
MRTGHHISAQAARIEYKELRKTSPEAARRAVVEYWRSKGHDVFATARMFGVNCCLVYDILSRWAEADLQDRPKTPRHQPKKTTAEIGDRVTAAKHQARTAMLESLSAEV